MANETTMNKLYEMKLSSFARSYRDQEGNQSFSSLSFDERLSLLVDAEWDARRINKRTRLLRNAGFSLTQANVADIRYDADRNLDKGKIEELAQCKWIKDALNVIITGSTGAGKSWLSCALGVCACNNFFSVKYIRLPRLLDELALARESDDYKKWQKRYLSCDLLIVDDWLFMKLTEKESREVLEIIEARHTVHSTMLCSQYSPGEWHEKLGKGAIADAVIDRLVYNSHTIHVEGSESMRKRISKL